MPKKLRALLFVALLCAPRGAALAWDDTGHLVVAQVANGRLSDRSRAVVERLLVIPAPPPGRRPGRGLVFNCDKLYDPVNIANWMDDLRDVSIADPLRDWHHINFSPFFDGVPEDPAIGPKPVNVLTQIRFAAEELVKYRKKLDQETPQKRLRREDHMRAAEALGYLYHLVGDVHQPLHATTRYSPQNPDGDGDAGGNGFPIVLEGQPDFMQNLHAFWDGGGGLWEFRGIDRSLDPATRRMNGAAQKRIAQLAARVMERFPAGSHGAEWKKLDPQVWVEESNAAGKVAFRNIRPKDAPTKAYAAAAQETTQRRLAFAGYRLAETINRIFQ